MNLGEKSFSLFKREVILYVLQIFTSAVIARVLGPKLLGVALILNMIPSYAETFGRLKFDIAAVYYLGKNKYPLNEVIFTLNILALFSSSIVVLIFFVNFDFFSSILFSKTEQNVDNLVYVVLAQTPLSFVFMNYSYLFLFKEDTRNYNIMVVLKSLITSLLGIILVGLFNFGIMGVVLASSFGLLISVFFGVIKMGSKGTIYFNLNFKLIKDLTVYGSKLYFQGLITNLQLYCLNLLVVFYLVPSQVTYFTLAKGYSQLLDKIPNALSSILFPRLSKIRTDNDGVILTNKAFRIISFILFLSGILALLFIRPAVYVIFGEDYLPLVVPFFLLIPGIVISGSCTPFLQYFMAHNRVEIGMGVAAVGLFSQLLMGIFLIPKYGVVGAAISVSMGLIISSIITFFVYKVIVAKMKITSEFLIKKDEISYLIKFITFQIKKLYEPR